MATRAIEKKKEPMVNPKYIGEVLDIIEAWVPGSGTRAALLVDLLDSTAAKKNTSFRETIKALITLHAQRRKKEGKK